ncbi:MAG: contractile injection system tape measure protein [Bacteroidota bacterium]
MKTDNTHIISRLEWKTSFDSKEKAGGLQERLSAWSRWQMPREAGSLLDKLCPPDQTWSINELELDLGPVDYNDLEFELTAKLRKALNEKLLDLIFYRGNPTTAAIEITTRFDTQLEWVAYFLQTGLMPWSYPAVLGSINNLLAYQLKNNRQNMIVKIHELGTASESVRKRIAWQIQEPVIHQIIIGLEPSHNTEIIDFTEELSSLQREKNLIRTNFTAFKKQLWFWVFNYLLKERGTLFNKLTFFRSSLKQMAEQYNIRYEELLAVTEEAVALVSAKRSIRTDFIITLKALSKENREPRKTEFGVEEITDQWMRLEDLFTNASLRERSTGKREFNELLIQLQRQDKSRLRSLLYSLRNKETIWDTVINDLDNAATETLFICLNPSRTDSLLESVYFLNEVAGAQNLVSDSKRLWSEAVKFLLDHRNAAFDDTRFMDHCIEHLAIRNGISQARLYCLLVLAKLPGYSHSPARLEAYANLLRLCHSSLQVNGDEHFIEQVMRLIEIINDEKGRAQDSDHSIQIRMQSLRQGLHFHPGAFLNALSRLRDKELVRKLILDELSKHDLKRLLDQADHSQSRLLLSFIDLLKCYQRDEDSHFMEAFADEILPELAIKIILFYPQLTGAKYIQKIIKGIFAYCTPAQSAIFYRLILKIKESNKEILSEIKYAINVTIKTDTVKNRNRFNPSVILRLAAFPDVPGEDLSPWLVHHFDTVQFRNLREENKENAGHIINRLLKNGKSLMDEIVGHYHALWQKKKEFISALITEEQLRELFWRILVGLKAVRRNEEMIRTDFAIAIAALVSPEERVVMNLTEPGILRKERVRLVRKDEETVISNDDLFRLIENVISTDSKTVNYKGIIYELPELISSALITDAERFGKIIANGGSAQQILNRLKSAIAFSEFSFWIMGDRDSETANSMRELRSLHDLCARMYPGFADSRLSNRFWIIAFEIIKGKISSVNTIKRIAEDIFRELTLSFNVSPRDIVTEMNSLGIGAGSVVAGFISRNITDEESSLNKQNQRPVPKLLSGLAAVGMLDELIFYIISTGLVPSWFRGQWDRSLEELTGELLLHFPGEFLKVLKRPGIGHKEIDQVTRLVRFTDFIKALGLPERARYIQLGILEEFYRALGSITYRGISSVEVQAMLFGKIIGAWRNNNWNSIDAAMIWNELMWELTVMYGPAAKCFIEDTGNQLFRLPPALQTAYTLLYGTPGGRSVQPAGDIKAPVMKKLKKINKLSRSFKDAEGIVLKNAGIVLLNSYIPLLFERLGIVRNGQFLQASDQTDAVHHLQYIVTGFAETEEVFLPLNKVLCGLPVLAPVKSGLELLPENKKLINGLIEAAIHHWPAIGETSIDGFRGNWLVRDGLLHETEDKWQLTVEKRSYDILLHRSPFSFSVIKFSWMDKPLKVVWPY